MAGVNVNVNAQGLSEILSALIALQGQLRGVGKAARDLQSQIPSGAPSGGGRQGGGSGSGNAGGPPSAAADAARSRAIQDNARRESSALVSAYAEVAGTVFALTAAFNGLKNAAQFGSMLTAQDNFARATGTNMQTIAKAMQSATKYALDFKQSAQYASIGRLAGFSTKQIVELAQAGTSAATILGRDVPEALSRMFRGVAKGEPEILDELGIFIRLDNAYKAYIKTVASGQKVFELTAYQRRQATRMAAIEAARPMSEGNANASIDDFTIAAAQLSTTFTNLMLSLTNILGPVVKAITGNIGLLVGAISLLGGSMMGNLSNILANMTKASERLSAAKLANATATTNLAEKVADRNRQLSSLATPSQVRTLAAATAAANTADLAAKQKLLDSYKAIRLAQIAIAKQAGTITTRQASAQVSQVNKLTTDSPKLIPKAIELSNSSGLPPPTVARLQANIVGALQASQASSNALGAANARTAISFASVAAASKAAGSVIIASYTKAAAAIGVVTAYVKAGLTMFMTFAGSLLTITAIIGGIVMLGKGLLSWTGLLNKNLKDVEDSAKAAGNQLNKTFASMGKMGKFKLDAGFSGAIGDANIFNNILDSSITELNNLLLVMKDVNNKETMGFFGMFGDKANFGQSLNHVASNLGKITNPAMAENMMKTMKANIEAQIELDRVRTLGTFNLSTEMETRVRAYDKLANSVKEQAKLENDAIKAGMPKSAKLTELLSKEAVERKKISDEVKSMLVLSRNSGKTESDLLEMQIEKTAKLNQLKAKAAIGKPNLKAQAKVEAELAKIQTQLDTATNSRLAEEVTAVFDQMDARAEALRLQVTDLQTVTSNLSKVDGEGGLSLENKAIYIEAYRTELEKLAQVNMDWVGSLDAGKIAMDKFTAEYDAMAKTMVADSSFEGMVLSAHQVVVGLNQILKSMEDFKGSASFIDAKVGLTESQLKETKAKLREQYSILMEAKDRLGMLNKPVSINIAKKGAPNIREVGSLIESNIPGSLSIAAEALTIEMKQVAAKSKEIEASLANSRRIELDSVDILKAKLATLTQYTNVFSKYNVDISKYTSILSDSLTIEKDINVALEKRKQLIRLNAAKSGLTDDSAKAVADANVKINDLAKERFVILNRMENELFSVSQKALNIPIDFNITTDFSKVFDEMNSNLVATLQAIDNTPYILAPLVTMDSLRITKEIAEVEASIREGRAINVDSIKVTAQEVDTINTAAAHSAEEAKKKEVETRELLKVKLMEANIQTQRQMNLWAEIEKRIAKSVVQLADYSDLFKSIKDLNNELYPTSLNEQAQAKIDLIKKAASDKGIALNTDDTKAIAAATEAMKERTKLLGDQYSLQQLINESYMSQAEAQQIVTSELRESNKEVETTGLALSNMLNTFNTEAVAKISSMQQKLRDAIISKAETNATASIGLISDKDIGLDNFSGSARELKIAMLDLENARKYFKTDSVSYKAALDRKTVAEKVYKDNFIKEALAQAEASGATKLSADSILKAYEDVKKIDWNKAIVEGIDSMINSINEALMSGDFSKVNESASSEARKLAGKASKNQLTDALKGLKDKFNLSEGKGDGFINKAKGLFNDLTSKFPKLTSGITAALPGLGMALSANNKAERNAGLGNAAGSAIGFAFGGTIGAAIGGVLGSVVGSAFTKKLTDTGFAVKVSAAGDVVANEVELYKKRTLTGTKRSEKMLGSMETEALSALNNVIRQTRNTYVSSLLQFNHITKGVFGSQLTDFKAFSGKYLNSSKDTKGTADTLMKEFTKDYGTFIAKDQFGFLREFQTATESLTDTLTRMANILTSSSSSFKTLFGRDLGILGNMTKTYVGSFLDTTGTNAVASVTATIDAQDAAAKAAAKKKKKKRFGGIGALLGLGGLMGLGSVAGIGGLALNPLTGVLPGLNMLNNYLNPKAKLSDIRDYKGRDLRSGMGQELDALQNQGIMEKANKSVEDLYFNNISTLINSIAGVPEATKAAMADLAIIEKYMNGLATSAEKDYLYEKARINFLDKMVKAFDGKDIAEKTAAYNKAMETYSSAVSSSIISMANSFGGITQQLDNVDIATLPDGLKATKDGLLTPIQEFNRDLQKAVEEGVSPEKMAEGLKLGAKLAEIIQGVLDSFSQINIAEASSAASFATSVVDGISSTFKNSAIDNFKKSLLAPLLSDITTSIATATDGTGTVFKSSMDNAGYQFSGDKVVEQANNMVSVLSAPGFADSVSAVSAQFERLVKVFDGLNTSKIAEGLNKTIEDITKTLKLSAYSFAVDDNAYSINIFKAREAFKEAGLSANLASMPIKDVFAQVKLLASQGKISSDSINAVNDALHAMADASISARDQLVATADMSRQAVDASNAYMKTLTYDVIDDSGSLEAAKKSLASLTVLSADKVAKAKQAYEKAKTLGDSLDINKAAVSYESALETFTQDQIQANNTLKGLAESKYEAEKTQLDTLKTIISDIATFMKDIKFDEALTILKPIDRLKAAEFQFSEMKAKVAAEAAAGSFTPESIKALQDDSKQLLDLGRNVYASGDEYTKLYNDVMATLASVSDKAAAAAVPLEVSTLAYQNMALDYAKQSRDLQMSALGTLAQIARASAIDNAISVDLINALKFNNAQPAGLTLNDYYNKLFNSAQQGGTIFTQPNTGYTDFTNVGNYNTQNTVQNDITQAKLNAVLETLSTVLANLPVDIKSAIKSTSTTVTTRN